jgi:excisionase family DNA binding protein
MYSLEQVAERLGLHVRTVRGYVRSGRLKAVRIGKQYRVAREDLEAITGPTRGRDAVHRHRPEVSSVIHIDAVSQDTARRVTNLLGAAKSAREETLPLRVETIYDEERARMTVIVWGTLASATDTFKLLGAVIEA